MTLIKVKKVVKFPNEIPKFKELWEWPTYYTFLYRDHPFKTSAFFRVGGDKNLPNLPTDSSKKLPKVGG